MKLHQKHKKILTRLRKNSRESFAQMSRVTRIPVSTVFDYHKKLQKNYIQKYSSLIDFKQIGFGIRVMLYVKAQDKEALQEYLMAHPHVNNLMSMEKLDFCFDVLFRTLKDYYDFLETLEPFRIEKLEEHDLIEELKLEGVTEL
ncbi:MAG: Lrp/AsnC family transcriptional regulator [archaeon]